MRISSTLFLLLLLLVSGLASAQEETTEDELPEIPYYRSATGFNVPILGEGWEDRSTDEVALFVHEALGAQIHVTTVQTLDTNEAAQTAIAQLTEAELPEPFVTETIGLTDGTWNQILYRFDDVSITSLAQLRSTRSYVITYYEDSPAYDAFHLAVRNSDSQATDATAGIESALETVLALADAQAQSSETISLPSGDWQQVIYEDDITAYGFVFRGITFTTLVQGNPADGAEIADAYDTIFLGFFTTPQNDEFLYLGLGASALIFLALLGSMWLRYQNARKDLAVVEQLAAN